MSPIFRWIIIFLLAFAATKCALKSVERVGEFQAQRVSQLEAI